MRQQRRSRLGHGLALVAGLALGTAPPAIAQIIPDATLPTNSAVTPGCTTCVITGGTERGANLYHSFREFSVPTGGTAWFNNAPTIQTILTRVTGSSISTIDGLLRTNGTASLFLLNPNGIVLGANARLQIGGSFFASTADRFQFPDGSEFSATNPQAPPLLTINVAPGLQSGRIAPGTTLTHRGTLSAGKDLILEGDRLDLQGNLIAGQNLTLKAQDTVQIRDTASTPVQVQSQGTLLIQGNQGVDISVLNHPASSITAGQNLTLRSALPINGDAHFRVGGTMRIEQLDGSLGDWESQWDPVIFANGDFSFGNYTGASLHILAGGAVTATGTIAITGTGPVASTINPTSLPQYATVPLSDGTVLTIDGSTRPTLDIRAGIDWASLGGAPGNLLLGTPAPQNSTVGSATSANIAVNVVIFFVPDGLLLLSNQYQPRSPLPGGNITVRTLFADDVGAFTGNGGTVVIDGRANLTVTNLITTTSGSGNAGAIALLAKDTTTITGFGVRSNVSGGTGQSGNIAIRTGSLAVTDGAQLETSIDGTGAAGNIIISARDRVLFDNGFAFSNVADTGVGTGGTIQIEANSLTVRNNAQLIANTEGTGNAGNVRISTRDRVLFDNGFAFSGVEAGATGNAGTIQIDTHLLEVFNGAQLNANALGTGNAGDVRITASDRVVFSGTSADGNFASGAASNVGDGNQRILPQGSGGTIQINTHSLEVRDGAQLTASIDGTGDAGNIVINARDRVLFDNGFAFSSTGAGAIGTGGNIQIDATALEVRNGAQLAASTEGVGDAGNVWITVRDRVLFDNGFAFSNVDTGATGTGGNIHIDANTLDVRNGGQLIANTQGTGNAGNVWITVRDRVLFDAGLAFSSVDAGATGTGGNIQIDANALEVRNGSQLLAVTLGEGNAGNVQISARDRVLFSEQSLAVSSVAATGVGTGGTIQIDANELAVLNGAQLIANTLGTGDAGDVLITTRDRVLFDNGFAFSSVDSGATGTGGNIQIAANTLAVLNGAQLSANTRSTGDAGTVQITAHDAVQVRGTDLFGRSSGLFTSTAGAGNGGDIRVNTRALQVADGGVVDTQTTNRGNSGEVTIHAATVDLVNGGQLLAVTEGSGRAGSVTVNAAERLTVAGTDATYATRLAQFGDRVAPVSAASGIYVRSQGTGGAGDITVTTPELRMDRGVISAESAAVDGGNINLNVGRLLLMRRNSLISATAGTAQQGGNGGNITINAPQGFIIGVKGENSDITANAFTGSGGRVTIATQGIFGLQFRPALTRFSDITASSTLGVSGTVAITTLGIDPSRGLQPLPGAPVDPTRQIVQTCVPQGADRTSSFTQTGAGGLPPSPTDPLQSDAVSPAWVTSDRPPSATSAPPTPTSAAPTAIVEAQGWIVDATGAVYLVAENPQPTPQRIPQTLPPCPPVP